MKSTINIALERLDEALPTDLQIFWHRAAQAAEARNWELYLVGGAVRDLLLSQDQSVCIPDLDLVVSAEPVTPTGAAIDLARDLQAYYPESRLADRPAFQTATLYCGPDGPTIDLATARIETYAYPGSHPQVVAGSIYQDLQRRDFTINALALRLTGPAAGGIVDFFGGMADLDAKVLRVLHDRSFQDDPTRLFRGARFATRLNLEWAAETAAQWRSTLASGVFQETLEKFERVHSLQTRLQAELKYMFNSPEWLAGIQALQVIDGWRCLHPQLEINEETYTRLRRLEMQAQHLDLAPNWLMRLEAILAGLNLPARQVVAEQLQLPAEVLQRLRQLEVVDRLLEVLVDRRPSAVSLALDAYSVELLLQVMVWTGEERSQLIWRYLTEWSKMRTPLDGKDLKVLGYPPGSTYRVMLQNLLGATRDGLVLDRQTALDFLHRHHPL